jgi:hypothetical protein
VGFLGAIRRYPPFLAEIRQGSPVGVLFGEINFGDLLKGRRFEPVQMVHSRKSVLVVSMFDSGS